MRMLSSILGIWFAVWAIRQGGELDYDLSPNAKFVRWVVVSACLGGVLAAPQFFEPPNFRLGVAIVGIAFLVWPNFAYHLTNILAKVRPKGRGEQAS